MSAEPILVGILPDRPGPEGPMIAEIRRVVDQTIADGRIDRPVTFVTEQATGLPEGTAAQVANAFHRLVARDVLVILGPTVTDNGLIATDLADQAQIPCINWTGSERTRSEWMFHYQIGSLEEEPHLLAAHLSERGLRRLAVVQDRSPIGSTYGSFFDDAAHRLGLQIVGKTVVSPVATDLATTVVDLQKTNAEALVYLGLGISAGTLGQAMTTAGWQLPAVANSALMFGYAYPDWTTHWEGWTYADAWSERNPRLSALLKERQAEMPDRPVFPMTLAAGDDLGRLLAEALANTESLTRRGIRDALERIKCLPATLGLPGTTMGFGHWERAALKDGFLVLRRWEGGRSVAV